jgi:hypothetical protein
MASQPDRLDPTYDEPAGGITSLSDMRVVSLRRTINQVAIGIAMATILRQRAASPRAVAACGSLLPKTSISAPGTKLANSEVNPKHKPNSPGQPHKTVATTVAIRLVFLLFIHSSPQYDIVVYPLKF